VDVRPRAEWDAGHLEGAMHIDLVELRRRIDEIPDDKPLAVMCGTGYRSYVAQRILINMGRKEVYNTLGGRTVIKLVQIARAAAKNK